MIRGPCLSFPVSYLFLLHKNTKKILFFFVIADAFTKWSGLFFSSHLPPLSTWQLTPKCNSLAHRSTAILMEDICTLPCFGNLVPYTYLLITINPKAYYKQIKVMEENTTFYPGRGKKSESIYGVPISASVWILHHCQGHYPTSL